VNIGLLRQAFRIDFYHRTKNYQVPVGARLCHLPEELQIHALVDHAEEAEARVGDLGLVCGVSLLLPRLPEVRSVDAAREQVDVVMPVALAFVERLPG
jgi:hypothetical protein